MERDGLFLEIPLLSPLENGLAGAERLAGVGLQTTLKGLSTADLAEAAAQGRLMAWQGLQTRVRAVVGYWLATLAPEHQARMDARLFERYALDRPPVAEAADSMLRAELHLLLTQVVTRDAFWFDKEYQIVLMPTSLGNLVTGQLLDAIHNRRAYRVCDHCGRPFAYKSDRATYCGPGCKTLAWRKRKGEGGK